MEVDPTRMCELLVGLPEVTVLGVVDELDAPIVVHVETRDVRPSCVTCLGAVVIKDRPCVELVDLPCFGRPARLVWRKRRWSCANVACAAGSWTEDVPAIAARRLVMTDRAGRWVTEQVGRHGRTVNEVAAELGCDWHTVNDTVIAYGTALVDDAHGMLLAGPVQPGKDIIHGQTPASCGMTHRAGNPRGSLTDRRSGALSPIASRHVLGHRPSQVSRWRSSRKRTRRWTGGGLTLSGW